VSKQGIVVRFSGEEVDLYLLQNVQTGPGIHPILLCGGYQKYFSCDNDGPGVEIAYLHLPKLGMSGALPPLSICIYEVQKEILILLLFLPLVQTNGFQPFLK
jgi:hypothetical protein